MRVIAPDPSRMIDLPGVGPCPRPVDIDQTVTGFRDLVSLRVYDFGAGAVIDGEAEGDEVIVALLSGAVTIEVTGARAGPGGAGFTLHADGDRAIYLPPLHRYRLTPLAPAIVAYARARADARSGGAADETATAPRAFAPANGVLAVEDAAERLRLRLIPLLGDTDASAGLDEGLERLALVTAPAGVGGEGATELGALDTLVLAPGEGARLLVGSGEVEGGELLAVAALRLRG